MGLWNGTQANTAADCVKKRGKRVLGTALKQTVEDGKDRVMVKGDIAFTDCVHQVKGR